ncbi:hypothetical protein TNCV_884841 [Trichonephila clavipes]|nr:hypothetical protein TNCV_884841 [Trichonephila clavipes]
MNFVTPVSGLSIVLRALIRVGVEGICAPPRSKSAAPNRHRRQQWPYAMDIVLPFFQITGSNSMDEMTSTCVHYIAVSGADDEQIGHTYGDNYPQ